MRSLTITQNITIIISIVYKNLHVKHINKYYNDLIICNSLFINHVYTILFFRDIIKSSLNKRTYLSKADQGYLFNKQPHKSSSAAERGVKMT